MDTTENVVTLGNLEEKKSKRKPKKRKMKQAVSVPLDLDGVISEQTVKIEDGNFATQNSLIEQNIRNQALCDSAQEGASRFKSFPVRAGDNTVSEDRRIDQDILGDRPKDGKKRKLKKRKRNVESDLSNSCHVGLSLNSSTANDTNHQEGTEILISETAVTADYKHDTLGISKLVSSGNDTLETEAVGTTTPMSVDSFIKMGTVDITQNIMLDVDPHVMKKCEIGRTKSPNSSQVDLKKEYTDLPQIFEGRSLVGATEGTHVENVKKLDEMPRSKSSKDLIQSGKLKENEDSAKIVGSLLDGAADQETQTPKSNCLKKKRRRKKPANSHLEELKEGERLPNQIAEAKSIGDAGYALSTEGIVSVSAESTHVVIDNFSNEKPESRTDTENTDDQRLKPPQHSEGDKNITEELAVTGSHRQSVKSNQDSRSPQNQFTADLEENICKIETVLDMKKNDVCAEYVVTASKVAVSDTQNLNTCKNKKKKMKRKLSSVSQLELNDEDRARDSISEPSPLNDIESKQSREKNIVATGKGIPISYSQLDEMPVLNNNAKKVKMQELHESAGGYEDQQTSRVNLNNESMRNLDHSGHVAREPNAENFCKLSDVKVEDFQADQSLVRRHSGFAAQVTSSPKDSSKISYIHEDICDKKLTVSQEGIVGMPCVIAIRTPDMCLQNTSTASLEQDNDMRASSLSSDVEKDVCGLIPYSKARHEKLLHPSLERNCVRSPTRKLLILDINGLLADIVAPVRSGYKPDTMVSQKAVFRRPFCESFLQFCFEKFDVGVWSSRVKKNVDKVLDFLMGELKNKLIFYWDRSHCTITGFPTVENRDKPLVLKELKKLWEGHLCHVAWEKGKYDRSNTLLLDDSPYKALRNPADTAIFPLSYQYTDVNDCSLGPGGDLRVYLERLAMADNIPEHVKNNPFGQRPIRETNLSWKYYKKVLNAHPMCPNR